MSIRYGISFGVIPVVVFTAMVSLAEDKPLSREYFSQAREAAGLLVRDLELLQEVIIAEVKGKKERTLYRQADAALNEALSFVESLKGGKRADLYKRFDELDEKIHQVLDGVKALGEGQRAVHRAASYLQASDDQLHYALSEGDVSEARTRKVIERQSRALTETARELYETAAYAFGDDPALATLQKEIDQLVKSADRFQKGLEGKAVRGDLKRDFKEVNAAWQKVTQGLKGVSPKENVYLLRGAVRMDRLHERLFRLLGIEGERPQIIIRT
jgi:hypothetical protein